MPIEVSLTNEEKVRIAVTPLTAGGQPATLDGPVEFTIAGDCTLDPIDDTSTWVLSGSTVGDSTMTVKADADLGAGVTTIMDTAVIHVAHPNAASLGLAADPPVLKV
jgi:hypothetical protein